jgi:hypothetical protein
MPECVRACRSLRPKRTARQRLVSRVVNPVTGLVDRLTCDAGTVTGTSLATRVSRLAFLAVRHRRKG